MSEVVVLGSGTSTGVPQLGTTYSEEFLSNPKNNRFRSSILIKAPKGNILVDSTPDMRIQLLREKIKMIHSVIITHSHADHIFGMDDLRNFSLINKKPIPIYTGQQFQQDIQRVFKYAFEKATTGQFVPQFELKDIQEELDICGLKIRTMWVVHGNIKVIAIRVNNFAYVTDVNMIPDLAWEKLQNLDVLMLDAVRCYATHPCHFNLEQATHIAGKLAPKKTYFTHLNHDFDHDVINGLLPANMELAYDGLKIQI